MTLLSKLDQVPPFAFRYLARDQTRFIPITRAELAKRTGLSVRTVIRLSQALTWKGHMNHYDAFVSACGFDPLRPSEARLRLKRICLHPRGLDSARHLTRQQKELLHKLLCSK